jgi:hypothetical protein
VTHVLFAVRQKCAQASKLKHFADPLEDGWSPRKPLKTRDILDRSNFHQRPPRRSPRSSSAAQPIDPPIETAPTPASVAFLRHPAQIDAQMHTTGP